MKVVIFLLLPFLVSSSKIFFLGYPSYSHLRSMSIIGSLLVERGHEVWISATSGLSKRLNLAARNLKTVPFESESALEECLSLLPMDEYLISGKRTLLTDNLKNTSHIMLTDEQFMSTIKKLKFDLIVLDITPIVNMLNLIPYKFDIPFVYFGPGYFPHHWKIPFSPSFVPFIIFGYTDKMTFTERLINTIMHIAFIVNDPFSYYRAAAIYAPEKPYMEIYDLILRAELFLWERNELLIYPSPTMPHVKPLNLVSYQPKTIIPTEFHKFMDKSKHGVVLVSFGSQTPTENISIFHKLVKAFTNTKYDFIIKGHFVKSNQKMMVADWIPQNALLGHPNLKLFVTHCGANGINEAIVNGVPMLGLPIFAEQPGNANLMENREFGLYLELWDTTSVIITQTINEIIDNPKYKKNIQKAASLYKELSGRQNSTEEAVYWIEHILKFGGEHFRSSTVDMPLYQYLLLDVLAFIGVVLTIISVVIIKVFRICLRSFSNKRRKQD